MNSKRKPTARREPPRVPSPIPAEAPAPTRQSVRERIVDAVDQIKAAHQCLVDALDEDLHSVDRMPVFHRTTVDATARRLWIAAGALQAVADA